MRVRAARIARNAHGEVSTVSTTGQDFTLEEARAVLAAVRDTARDALRLPLSAADLAAIASGGIEVKSPGEGLLDFPTRVNGVPAYWCWRVGESEIEWWHPRDTGFAGRRRIAPGA